MWKDCFIGDGGSAPIINDYGKSHKYRNKELFKKSAYVVKWYMQCQN